MADCIRQGVMFMKRVFLWIAIAVAFAVLLSREDHYDAIRHEFYEVWDSMDRRMGEEK